MRTSARHCCPLLLGVLVSALTACNSGHQDPADADTSVLRVALKSDLRGTNPGVTRDAVTDNVLLHIVEGLVAYRGDFSVAPLLAREIDVSEDGRRYRFHLREDVFFHNGARLTADEVVWTWQRLLEPATGWLCRGLYDGSQDIEIVAIRAPDQHTVDFHLDSANTLFLDYMASFQCLAGVLHPSSVDARGEWIEPVGTGPYRLERWERGKRVVLKAFDKYWSKRADRDGMLGGKHHLIPRLEWLVIPDPSAAQAGLQSGQLDILHAIDVTDAEALSRDDEISLYRSESLDWSALLINSDEASLASPAVRRGIEHALDRRTLAQVVTDGISAPNPSIVARANGYFAPCHERTNDFAPARARELLAELAGKTVTIQTNKRYRHMYDAAIIIQALLRDVGVDAELEVLEWATQLNNYMDRNFELMTFGYTGRPHPALAYAAVLGDPQRGKFYQWHDEEARSLLEQASKEANPSRVSSIFCRLHEKMIEQVPMINLFNFYGIDATRNTVAGYAPWSARKPRLWGVHKQPAREGR